MTEILNRDSELNKNKGIKLISTSLSLALVILILLALIQIVRNNLNLNNPLVTESLKSEINAPHIQNAIAYSIALIIILILKYRTQNILAIIIGVLTIGIYL
ncbi:hypothetical protein [Christiangramia sabulilitoris]|uniref:Uncharacterized protein n=1 Tax=Christiangramia sabulilitoris TaxID=2583991 RepID=A0A550I762_9FLAO|nr:hypothetical protein [Christiangramia sabulilitoris]TRO66809.1 hypothetical protein FGM01_02645 [Christiangramia sabulilitoris]